MPIFKVIIFLVCIGIVLSDPVPNKHDYFGFIFDAGSTGTRLSIFQIMVDDSSKAKSHNNYPVKFIKKMKCNIAFNQQTDLGKAKTAIDQCIEGGTKEINAISKQHKIWMKFIGTGGLRNLENSNKEKFDELMNGMRALFRTKNTINPKNMDFVEVAEDETEAEYDFIASIYKEGTETVEEKGVVDIGGSSLQVGLPIPPKSKGHTLLNKRTVHLFDQHIHYGILNFKCGGVNNIKSYYLETNDASKPINSPCHPKGFSETIETTNFANACTKSLIGRYLLPRKITINGIDNDTVCTKKLMESFCSDSDANEKNKCIIKDSSYTPISVPEQIKLTLMGSWMYFSNELSSSDYIELVKRMTDMFNKKDCFYNNVERCFSSKYLKFITSYFVKPTDQAVVNANAPNWTLGKMLLDTKFLFLTRSYIVAIIVTIVVTLVIGVGLLSTWLIFNKRKPANKPLAFK